MLDRQEKLEKLVENTMKKVLGELKQPLFEMAVMSEVNKDLQISIYREDNGYIPHFHIEDKQTHGYNFSTCIRFDDNRYFLHGNHKSILNSKERKALNNAVRKQYKNGFSLWQEMIRAWNMTGSKIVLDKNLPIPDYTTIKL